jgi:ribonuclease HI
MGFRDLRLFNMGMLGKQGWRLIQNPDSLCARVLKGRYFHDSEFLQATRKKHSSHTWRAILAGREVLSKGLVRRIGDGNTTRIWQDRWLPGHFNGKPITTPVRPQVDLVSDLLTPSGRWNAELIKQLFFDVDAQAILSMPVRGMGNDSWAWELERHGMYSVRSAYHCLFKEQWQQQDTAQASSSGDITWSRIWKLCVPPKVRVFWWRVVNDFLPAKDVLNRRHIEPIANCDVCGDDKESVKHVLLECTMAKYFWNQTKSMSGVKIPPLHPLTWARDLVDPGCVPPKDAAVILCGMWALWMARNSRRHGEVPRPVKVAAQWAIDTAFDLWQLLHPEKERQCTSKSKSWERPANGWVKCNVDAAFYNGNRSAASGAILRDEDGRTCGGTAKWYEYCLNALAAEALACCDGMILARDRGVRRLILETDCQVLTRLWENRSHQRSEISALLTQMEEISRSFEEFHFRFISRNCNMLAHACTRLVSRDSQVAEWSITPPGLMDTINRDCNPDID